MYRLFRASWVFLVAAAMISAQEPATFQDLKGNLVTVEIDRNTGSGRWVDGLDLTLEDYGFGPERSKRDGLEVLGRDLIDDHDYILGIDRDDLGPGRVVRHWDWWFVHFQQMYQGIPVHGTDIGFSVTPKGRVVTLGAQAHPGIDVPVKPAIDESKALQIGQSRFERKDIDRQDGPNLVILPLEEKEGFSYRLAWKVKLGALKPVKSRTYFIDAVQGKLLREEDGVSHHVTGQVKGGYWPELGTDTPVTTGLATTNIQLLNQVGGLVTWTSSNSNGWYTLNTTGLPDLIYYVRFRLENQWIRVMDGDPVAVAYTTTRNDTKGKFWGNTDGTNVLWHGRIAHDFFADNLGFSGTNYRMDAHINQGSSVNAESDGTDLFFGTQYGLQWARYADIIYHEYTHNVIYQIYNGWIGPNYDGQASAMKEGLSDYFAATMTNDPLVGFHPAFTSNLSNSLSYNSNYNEDYNRQVIGGALWDLRQTSGVSIAVADNIAFGAMLVSPHPRNFTDYLRAALMVSNNQYGGAYNDEIEDAFSNHGISIPAMNLYLTRSNNDKTITAHASGGSPPFTYQWWSKPICSGGGGGDVEFKALSCDWSPATPIPPHVLNLGSVQDVKVVVTDSFGTIRTAYSWVN